jgi:hypothetical protein
MCVPAHHLAELVVSDQEVTEEFGEAGVVGLARRLFHPMTSVSES